MTDRLPFNPDLIKPPAEPKPARRERKRYGEFDATRPMNVTQVCELLKRVLADRMPAPLHVVGEISNFSNRKHWYFSLKDEQNVINCVMWSSAASRCRFTPERGQQVVATGRVDYYGPQGRLQLYVDKLEPVGAGALELRFKELCEQLRRAGYFAVERKKPMPAFPQHIAVITSAGGAALQDVIRTARSRWGGVRLSVVDVKVQGESAALQIAKAIHLIDRQAKRLEIDAIIVTRGGGSLEDLWAFNEKIVADAIFKSRTPIAAAIGHETDTTIAELVADLRCSTPTQAAAMLVPDARAERQRLEQLSHRLAVSLRRQAQTARSRLDAAAKHPIFRRPLDRIEQRRRDMIALGQQLDAAMRQLLPKRRERLGQLQATLGRIEPVTRLKLARHQLAALARRLHDATRRRVADGRTRIESFGRQLDAIGPRSVLARGYSYTIDANGRLVRSVADASPGQRITTHVVDGQIDSQVLETSQRGGGKARTSAKRPKRRKGNDASPGLFD